MRSKVVGYCLILGGFGCSAMELPPEGEDPVVCGDGVQGVGEVCDDGNTSNRDECTEDCARHRNRGWCDQFDKFQQWRQQDPNGC